MSEPAAAGPAPVVILCRPQMGENIGAAARAMLNFGLSELRVVAPECGWPNAKAVASASGAWPVLNEARLFPTARDATADLQHVFASTARPRELKKPVLTADAAARSARELTAVGRRVGLLFGPERTGLLNDELLLADAVLTIPANPAFTSLNLAQAVLLVASAWFRTGDTTLPAQDPHDRDPPASKGDIQGVVDHLLTELEAIDYFRSPDRRLSLGSAVQVMLERRQMTVPEVNLMRGIIKELVGGRKARDQR